MFWNFIDVLNTFWQSPEERDDGDGSGESVPHDVGLQQFSTISLTKPQNRPNFHETNKKNSKVETSRTREHGTRERGKKSRVQEGFFKFFSR